MSRIVRHLHNCAIRHFTECRCRRLVISARALRRTRRRLARLMRVGML